MKRLFALVLCLSAAHFGNAAPGGPKGQPVLLDVQPAAAPVPALKYQLLPEVAEMNPGNAVPAYLKCWAEQTNFFHNKEVVEERERLRTCPLTDIKPGSLKGYGGNALRQADFAARLEYADWNILPQLREQGFMLLIPEVQQIRALATALHVRGRGQIVDRDFDGAIGTLKTIFAISRHMGEHPTIISGLVGVAVAQIGCNLLEELIQQPGAPNLYWALTGLPPQLVDMRKAASADRSMWSYGMFDKTRVWTADYMRAITQQLGLVEGAFGVRLLASMLELPAEDKAAAEKWVQARTADAEWLTAARKGLTDAGYPADAVAKYPPQQVIIHDLLRKAKAHGDEMLKWVPVPYWQAEPAMSELVKAPAEIEDKLAQQFVASIPKVKAAHARLEQRLDMLRIAEAVRLEAAKNGGKLPARLSDLSVPVPIDPVSGKAFEYKVDGITAILAGKEALTGTGVTRYRYEIRLRK
jgi:hypothetical protein